MKNLDHLEESIRDIGDESPIYRARPDGHRGLPFIEPEKIVFDSAEDFGDGHMQEGDWTFLPGGIAMRLARFVETLGTGDDPKFAAAAESIRRCWREANGEAG